MELEQLLKKFKEKDALAFEQLYEMYYKNILGVVFNIVRDNDVAEEVTQDVFMKAWNNADSYNAKKGRFFTWMLNIARNAAIDKTRSKEFNKKSKNLDAEIFVDILQDNVSLDNRTDAIGIKAFVNKLADTCKKLIDLLYFKGYTQKEASESLEIPIGTVKTRNRNCLSNLRTMIE
ncbi:RNA polymerase sigma-70 factor (ECF subfamily) [Tenacibaculum skagerrakense]|uniref:RNA polymerase sigma-70 factor (ECF subfamily) n=1 Tax=Tenacibaculum skagerrakense TaxID=186571 RepID=A0A4R2P0S3_9FLAO|nr:sigma-70 family RNA polymerase sigma factor [Tenacibaculum skagerrakense]TCP28253.1 RNA polymerase sigma-70 factor (ECF subfamily) [Tenacibaculum skagerrakense]